MAHFAELDDNNIVLRVVRVADEQITDDNGVEQEQLGVAFLHQLLGEQARWVQTSYTGKFRACYASVGWTYDEAADVFVAPALEPEPPAAKE